MQALYFLAYLLNVQHKTNFSHSFLTADFIIPFMFVCGTVLAATSSLMLS